MVMTTSAVKTYLRIQYVVLPLNQTNCSQAFWTLQLRSKQCLYICYIERQIRCNYFKPGPNSVAQNSLSFASKPEPDCKSAGLWHEATYQHIAESRGEILPVFESQKSFSNVLFTSGRGSNLLLGSEQQNLFPIQFTSHSPPLSVRLQKEVGKYTGMPV